ncbi:hypothetical protein GF406_24015 [candidate division KSB1 bacterium]|nr:hypothetical protein [candidate division KSB1 bacterium]
MGRDATAGDFSSEHWDVDAATRHLVPSLWLGMQPGGSAAPVVIEPKRQ